MGKFNPEAVKFPNGPNCEGCPFRATSRGFLVPQGYSANYDPTLKVWTKYEPGVLWRSAEYLFFAEAGGKDEAAQGMNLVGGTGGIFNILLHQNTPLHRTQVAITNACKCRPVVHGSDGKPVRQKNGDYVNAKPSREQIEECFQRYFRADLQAFNGHTLMALGASAIASIAGHGRSLDQDQGAIFEHGSMRECEQCEGRGHLERPRRKCPDCKGKGMDKCPGCNRWKHTKKCSLTSTQCGRCEGSGTLPRPPRVCPGCKGNREVPSDPGNTYVSTRLKPGQVMLATYHPAFLMRKSQYKRMLERDFSRLLTLREELVIEKNLDYDPHPSTEKLDEMFSTKLGAIDFETTGAFKNDALDPERGEIQMTGFSVRPGQSICAMGESRHVYEWLKRASEDDSITVIGQNWSMFDAWWAWRKWGVDMPKKLWDTRLAGHLHNPDTPNKLVYLTREYANPPIRGFWKSRQHYRDDKPMVAMIDTDADIRVFNGQVQVLDKLNLVNEYWSEVWPTMQVAWNMRKGGWRVDLDRLSTAHDRVDAQLHQKRTELPEWPATASGERTENQHEHVKTYLYETLRLPVQLDGKTHQPSSGWEQRTELRNRLAIGHHSVEHLTSSEHAESLRFLDLIDHLQEDSKLITFLDPKSQFLLGDRFHPTWNPAGTATFRFSCADPNLQQIPKCACKPKKCYGTNPNCLGARFPFLGDQPGWAIGTTDYSQIEVVGFLWSAGQWEVLEKVLHGGLDAHEIMGSMLGMHRDDAKHMTFALVYGASDETIAAKSGKPLHLVVETRAQYLKTFTGVQEFRWQHIKHAIEKGYVESCFGRRRYIWVRNPIGRAANQAANAPIQGIPPMIVRRAMRRLDKELPKPARLLGNIHDELVWTCPQEMVPEVVTCITDVMRSPIPEMPAGPIGMHSGLVPNVETKVGLDWASCMKYKEAA